VEHYIVQSQTDQHRNIFRTVQCIADSILIYS